MATKYTVKQRILICLTQIVCQIWFGWIKGEETYPDESTSAFVQRTNKTRWISWINWFMNDAEHCQKAYESEKSGIQNAPEYRT